MASALFRLWYILYRRATKVRDDLLSMDSLTAALLCSDTATCGFQGFPWGREYTSFSFRSKISSNVSYEQSSPMYNALPWQLRFKTWSFIRLQSSPGKWSKAYEASSKVRLFPALLRADTKPNLSPTDIMLQGFPSEYPLASRASFITFAMNKSCINVLNYLWVTTLSSRVLKSYFDWSKCTDQFLGRLNWCQSSMKSPLSCTILNWTKFIVIIMIIYTILFWNLIMTRKRKLFINFYHCESN